jgi:hypothetical protein
MDNMEQDIITHNQDCPWHSDWHQCNCGLFDAVAYNEPAEDGSIRKNILTVEEAISRQLVYGKNKGYTYLSKDEAIEDFMALHWAWFEKI